MKKWGLLVLALSITGAAHATHLFRNNASNITAGTLSADRLPEITSNEMNATGVSAGTYNNADITVDAAGRITSASNGASSKLFDLSIGTLTAAGVDISSGNEDGLKTAILRLCGSSSSVTCATGGGTIFFRSGVYDIQDATIPYNVKVVGNSLSSTTFRVKNSSISMLTVYGTLENITLDYKNSGFTNKMISFKSGSTGRGLEFRNATLMAAGGGLFEIKNSSNVLIERCRIRDAGTNNGALGTIDLNNAVNSTIQDILIDTYTLTLGTNVFFYLKTSTDCTIRRVTSHAGGGRFILVSGGANNRIEGNRVYANQGSGGGAGDATFMVNTEDSVSVSSYTWFNGNEVIYQNVGGNNVAFKAHDATTKGTYGVIFSNNVVRFTGTGANTMTGFSVVNSGVGGTVLYGNHSYNINTFISDAGTGTKSASLGNFKDGLEQ